MRLLSKISAVFLLLLFVSAAIGCKKQEPVPADAQVMSSAWQSTKINPTLVWKEQTFDGIGKALTLELTDPEITADVIKNSIMFVYGRLNGYDGHIWPHNQVKLLRTLVEYRLGVLNRTDIWSAMPQEGKITVMLTNVANEYVPYGPSGKHEFRYIFIPKSGTVVTGKKPGSGANILARYSESDLRNMSYEQFCEVAGLDK